MKEFVQEAVQVDRAEPPEDRCPRPPRGGEGGNMAEFSFSTARRGPGGVFGAERLQRMRDVVNGRVGRLRIVLGDSETIWERQTAQGFFREAEAAGHETNALIRRFDDGTVYIAFRNSQATRAEVLEELYHLGQIRTGWWEAGFA